MPTRDPLLDGLDRLAGPRPDPGPVLEEMVRRHHRRRVRRTAGGVVALVGVIAVAVAVAGGAGGDRGGTRVEVVDDPPTVPSTPAIVDVVETESELPLVGELSPAWHEAFAVPYGDADDQLGAGKWGPPSAAPDEDGNWWVLDSGKARLARFTSLGEHAGALPLPAGKARHNRLDVLGGRAVTSGTGLSFVVADEAGATLADFGEGFTYWKYSDGTSLYGSNGMAISLADDGAVEFRNFTSLQAPNGNRFNVTIDGTTLDVYFASHHDRVRIGLTGVVEGALAVDYAADAYGTVHLLLHGVDDDGRQRSGYLTVTAPAGDRRATTSGIEPLRDRSTIDDVTGRLRIIPGTTTPALVYADADALRIFIRDTGRPGGSATSTTAALPRWQGLEVDPDSGVVMAPGFNETVGDDRPEWARTARGVAEALVGSAEAEMEVAEISEHHAGSRRSRVVLTTSNSMHDSIEASRYDLLLERGDDGLFRFVSGTWSQRCRSDRGHQEFALEPCL